VKPRALVVDDDEAVRYTLRGFFEDAELDVEEARDGAEALARLGEEEFHLVVADFRMPEVDGLELLRRLRDEPVLPKVIMITAHGSERHAVEAMKLGAYDYFRKPFEPDELLAVVERAVEAVRLQVDNDRLSSELNLARSMVFASEAMSQLAVLIQRVGPRDATVLITGESGTGKERVAEALVRASSRPTERYVRFNCAAIGSDIAEAELFGHVRGAFTGAHRARRGLFREADGGTLLLDEIGELEPRLQAKLLRIIQEGEVRPVGQDQPVSVDVRLLASTHRDLAQRVAEGRFREDLYYRLNVVRLHVPPLRERPEDITVLAEHFLTRFAERFGVGPLQVPDDLGPRLLAHRWPGNVRELQNAMESLVALSRAGQLDLSLLPSSVGGAAEATTKLGLREQVEAYERGLLVAALRAAGGNRTEAAKALSIGRATLHEKLRKYAIDEPTAS
jgi:two-component system response regulator HydG